MTSVCLARLRKEYRELQKRPVENIRAAPRESNLLEWHYVLEGPKGSAYEGGFYHGVVTFPKDYPYKPPSLQMFTPNGRFKVCLPYISALLTGRVIKICILLYLATHTPLPIHVGLPSRDMESPGKSLNHTRLFCTNDS
ncbi:ubiquitin-conjugating enzyme E2 [archaeon]|nr:MAG: ubiquitin-conjugating enzyme E2 [archaeon]